MATAPGPTPDHLSHLRRAEKRIARLAPFALLRGVEARAPQTPRIGTSKRPDDDLVDLVHQPSLAFPAATMEGIAFDGTRPRIEGHWLGLTGAMGPLPLHLTEFAFFERRYGSQKPFGRFLDVMTGRMLQLFYRAWAVAVPAASIDRPDDDPFGDQIAALSGARDGATAQNAFPAQARLRHAALFASPRSPGGLADSLGCVIRLPVEVVEYVERWLDIEPSDRTVLGGAHATLGRDAVAGCRMFTVEDAFKVVVHVATMRDLRDMLPGGVRYRVLAEAIDAFAPPHLDWEIELATASEAIRPARLGASTQLGWSSWSTAAPAGSVRFDVRLGAGARRLTDHLTQENTA